MSTVFEKQVLSVPARGEVDLRSEPVHTIRWSDVMGFWNVVSFVNTAETYLICHRPNVVVSQHEVVVMSQVGIARYHSETRRKSSRIRDITTHP